MDVLRRLLLAAKLSEEDGEDTANLPDAAAVAADSESWGLHAQLKAYQAEGVAWLIRRYARGVNAILGDEMGLGKTLQSIALLSYLVSKEQCRGPFLIVCPLSVTESWASELARFAPKLTALRYVGDKEEREGFRMIICNHIRQELPQYQSDPTLPFEVLLTTYELAVLDVKFLSLFRWRYTIIDEAQRLKNPSTVLYQVLQEQYMIPRRLLLTGTPVQNNLSELWSILHFCMPVIFDNLNAFLEVFGSTSKNSSEKGADVMLGSLRDRFQVLRCILGAFMLRRTKDTLVQTKALSLPPIVEITVFAPLVPVQKKVYLSVLRKEAPKMTAGYTGPPSQRHLNNIVIQLRKACSHLYLFDGVEPEPFKEGEHLVQASGKLIMLDLLLKRLHAKGHCVLLFAQMTRTLDIIQDYLQFRGYTYERLDGSIRAEERFAAVRNFSTRGAVPDSGDAFVFLLTTRAGGVGLNLVAADTVIFYEQDWNPQADKQALQRAHRIGQLRSVLVINLITENTFEEVIMRRARTKLELTHEVLGQDGSDPQECELVDADNSDIQSMIIFGLHKIVSQPVSSAEKTNTTLFNCSDVATKMNTIVESALSQRVKIGTADLKNELLEDASQDFGSEEAKDLNNLFRDDDNNEKMDMLALKSLETTSENGSDETSGRQSGRRGIKEATVATDLEAVEKKKQKKDRNLQAKWKSLGYKSLSVSDAEVKDNGHVQDKDTEYIHHLIGDCTKPKLAIGHRGIILWCLGQGRTFESLRHLSESIPQAYEAGHSAGDIHLGDLHLIPVSGTEMNAIQSYMDKDDGETHLWAALAVVQTYDGRRKVPQLKERFIKAASVHMPRIQVDADGRQGWYIVERLLRKYAATYHVHFNIYYFKRNAVAQSLTST